MKLISPKEAARKMGVHASTVYRMIRRSEVEHELVRVDRVRVHWDENTGLRFTSPAFKEKLRVNLAAVRKRVKAKKERTT
jgi:excisionase family DNA binding protein